MKYQVVLTSVFLCVFFFPLKVRDYSPPLLVIKSVWQDSTEVLWPSGHVAVAQAVRQTGLLAVMCYRAGDFKGLAHVSLGAHTEPQSQVPDGTSHKVKLDQIPSTLHLSSSCAKSCCNPSGRKQTIFFSLLLLLLVILRSCQLNVQLFCEVCKSGESWEVHFLC